MNTTIIYTEQFKRRRLAKNVLKGLGITAKLSATAIWAASLFIGGEIALGAIGAGIVVILIDMI